MGTQRTAAPIAAVIVAAGRGLRAGAAASGPKQFHEIGGEPVIARSVAPFLRHPAVTHVVVVHHGDDAPAMAEALEDAAAHVTLCAGGASRQHSVLNGLRCAAALRPEPGFALIHDGVRPFVDNALIDRVIAALDGDHARASGLRYAEARRRKRRGLRNRRSEWPSCGADTAGLPVSPDPGRP